MGHRYIVIIIIMIPASSAGKPHVFSQKRISTIITSHYERLNQLRCKHGNEYTHRRERCLTALKRQQRDLHEHKHYKQSILHAPSVYYNICRSLNTTKPNDVRLYASRYQPDIICLTETWFSSARDDNSIISEYNRYTTNRKDRVGGGVAVNLKAGINGKFWNSYTSQTVSDLWLLINNQISQREETLYLIR